VLVLALLVFGPKRLPQAGRSLGQAMREFRKATQTARAELGLDEVTEGIKDLKSSVSVDMGLSDLKSSMSVDLNAATATAGAPPVDKPVPVDATSGSTMPVAVAAAETTAEAAETTAEAAVDEPPAAAGADDEAAVDEAAAPELAVDDVPTTGAPAGDDA